MLLLYTAGGVWYTCPCIESAAPDFYSQQRMVRMIPFSLIKPDTSRLGVCRRNGLQLGRLLGQFPIYVILAAALACNAAPSASDTDNQSPTSAGAGGTEIAPRFLLGGWALPESEGAGPFAESLKGFVITTNEQLRVFLDDLNIVRVRGRPESLDQADLDKVVILAAYYLWRPLKGDPLSITGIEVKGQEVEIGLELLEDAQGRESPYLMAPLFISSLAKEGLPRGVPIQFRFLVNGKLAATRNVTLE